MEYAWAKSPQVTSYFPAATLPMKTKFIDEKNFTKESNFINTPIHRTITKYFFNEKLSIAKVSKHNNFPSDFTSLTIEIIFI